MVTLYDYTQIYTEMSKAKTKTKQTGGWGGEQ